MDLLFSLLVLFMIYLLANIGAWMRCQIGDSSNKDTKIEILIINTILTFMFFPLTYDYFGKVISILLFVIQIIILLIFAYRIFINSKKTGYVEY